MRDLKLQLSGILVMCLIALTANAAGDSMQAANSFLQLLRSAEFNRAADEFLYPAIYTPEELRSDKEGLASTLQSLFRATGPMMDTPLNQTGAFVGVVFKLNAGDRAHPLPKADPANVAAYRFAVPLQRYPDAAVSVELERVEKGWRIRMFQFSLPASDPSSPARMKTIFDRIQSDTAGSK